MSFFPEKPVSNPGAVSASTPDSTPPSSSPASEQSRTAKFKITAPRYGLDEVVLSRDTRDRLESLLARLEHHATIYGTWGLDEVDKTGRRVSINLYGPPGTGKTMCAEGLASRMGRPILMINYADLESKYVGETPKNIVAAFDAARERNAVLFFDEADSILGRRLTNVTQSADHGVNVSRSTMLLQLDRFEGIVVFATNLFRNYDAAFVRRILGHVELPLPDSECRTRLASRLFVSKLPKSPEITAEWYSEVTNGLSGGEMLNGIVNAALRAVRRPENERQLEREDLLSEVEELRKAKSAADGEASSTTIDEQVVAWPPQGSVNDSETDGLTIC